MIKQIKAFLATAVAAAAVSTSAANAATTVVIGAGSSAIWQTAAIGAYTDLAGAGKKHYTIKGTCTTGNCAQLFDSRSSQILPQAGNLWVVWDSAGNVWADLSVDSVVGNRSFFAVPRAKLQVSTDVETKAGQGLISSALWGNDATAIPSNVYKAINAAITAAFTDIRPEDAKFAESRATDVLGASSDDGLGYGTGPNTLVGTEIKSTYSTAEAQPVNFSLSGGLDPFNTANKVPASVTIPIGAAPIIFFINHASATGLPTNLTHQQLQSDFSGCAVLNGVAATTVVREPISGTMNTAEFTEFQGFGGKFAHSQENGVNAQNPLNITCTNNTHRTRAIGTGELVSSVAATTVPSIGYAFFGYGNFSKLALNPKYTYVTVDSSDPIKATYTNGQFPACTAPCPATPGSTFPNLRNGNYKSWSVLRVVTDASGTNNSSTKALVTAIQNNVNSTVPDFVPFVKVVNSHGTDPGLLLYRSHYKQSGINPNNGLSSQTEAGGDVGGCIEKTGPAPGVLNCHQ